MGTAWGICIFITVCSLCVHFFCVVKYSICLISNLRHKYLSLSIHYLHFKQAIHTIMGEKHCFSSSVDFFFLWACLLSDFNNFGSLIHKKVSKICHVLWVCTKSTIIQYIWYTLTVMLEWMLIEFILKVHVRDIHCLTIYCTLQMKSRVVTTAFK